MAVIASSPTKPIDSVSEMESVTNTNDNQGKAQRNGTGRRVSGSSRQRNRSPGICLVGSRIYDSKDGKSCHQCRQKTRDLAAECKNIKSKPCPIKYCHKCLWNRYGENAEEVANLQEWICPKCRGLCNCSLCMKKRGCQPTGILVHTAKANGYSCVSEMLQVSVPTNFNDEKSLKDFQDSPRKKAAPEMESSISSTRKRVKEKTVDDKVESNLQALSSPSSPDEENSKKLKLEESSEEHDEGTNNQVEGQDEKAIYNNNKNMEKHDDIINDEVEGQDEISTNYKNKNREADFEANVDLLEKEDVPEITFPAGTELTTIDGVQMPPGDVGKALQFLEFCAVFGQILEVKNGQPGCILRDLVDGRSSRPGRFSLTVQFHIRLISLIQEDQGQGPSDLSPTRGKDSWVHALKECISGSEIGSRLQLLEHLEKGAYGYENLNSSQKLTILNMLCDEVLGTADIRSWIDDQVSEHAEKAKEQKERMQAAKDKEKHLKQQMQDEVARAIIEKNGAPLSMSEHAALLTQIKLEVEQAHAEMLESAGIFKKRNRTSDAIRTQNIHLGTNGKAYWRLKCVSNSSKILVQDLGRENTSTLEEERWFSLDDEQIEVVEKHLNILKGKR